MYTGLLPFLRFRRSWKNKTYENSHSSGACPGMRLRGLHVTYHENNFISDGEDGVDAKKPCDAEHRSVVFCNMAATRCSGFQN